MTNDRFDLDGQSAIVTGGSKGIGREVAERLLDAGASVAICSRTESEVAATAEDLAAGDGDRSVVPITCDVTERSDVDQLIETAVDEFGGLDVLVNNAGGSFTAPFQELSENGWKSSIDVNLHGVFQCTQAASRAMDDGGVILNVASITGTHGSPTMSHYGAAKAGVINLTETLGDEFAADGIRVVGIAPGFVATPGIEEQMGVTAAEIDRENVDRRIGHPSEIADVALFLVSPAASFLTGETIEVSGAPGNDAHFPS